MDELLAEKVTLDVEGIDRLYLNLYQPLLQTGAGVATFFKQHRGAKVASTALMGPMSHAFVTLIHEFAQREGIELVPFAKGECKDEVTKQRLPDFRAHEGVLDIGKAQEKFATFRVTKKFSTQTGKPFPWLSRATVMCNHDYCHLVDEDFGPLFIKFVACFPDTARVCLNGYEYAKRQLATEGIVFEALDNGVLSCADPARLQQMLDALDAAKIQSLVETWRSRLPDPFTAEDHAAGFNPQLAVLQAEFSRTQVFDRPLSGQQLFEEIIRENRDLGRPAKISLSFQRRITKRTPGRFHSRVITQEVIPSLQVSYPSTKLKQYSKEGRTLRTETTINNTRDFGSRRLLNNLPALRPIAVGLRSRPSVRIASWPRGGSSRSPNPRSSTTNGSPVCASMMCG